jgi:hypothetical protein
VRGQRGAPRVEDGQLPVEEPSPRVGLDGDAAPRQRRAGPEQAQLQAQRGLARQTLRQVEAVLQAVSGVDVPLHQTRAVELDPGPLDPQRSGRDGAAAEAAPDAGEAQREQLGRAVGAAPDHPDPGGVEVGAQVVCAVGGLQTLGVGARLVLPVCDVAAQAGAAAAGRRIGTRRGDRTPGHEQARERPQAQRPDPHSASDTGGFLTGPPCPSPPGERGSEVRAGAAAPLATPRIHSANHVPGRRGARRAQHLPEARRTRPGPQSAHRM